MDHSNKYNIYFVFIFLLPQMVIYPNKILEKLKYTDTLFIYSGSYLYDVAESHGDMGGKAYIKQRWTIDLLWPFVYTAFLVSWTIKLLEYIPRSRRISYIFLLPIISMGLDFMENIGTTIVMSRYPLRSLIIASITPVISFIKWTTILGSVLMIIYLIILIIISKIKRDKI